MSAPDRAPGLGADAPLNDVYARIRRDAAQRQQAATTRRARVDTMTGDPEGDRLRDRLRRAGNPVE